MSTHFALVNVLVRVLRFALRFAEVVLKFVKKKVECLFRLKERLLNLHYPLLVPSEFRWMAGAAERQHLQAELVVLPLRLIRTNEAQTGHESLANVT